jgi:hypothetical protein
VTYKVKKLFCPHEVVEAQEEVHTNFPGLSVSVFVSLGDSRCVHTW